MEAQKVDMFMMTNAKYFEGHQLNAIRERLLQMDDDKFNKFLENLVKTNEVTEAITKDVTVTDEDVEKVAKKANIPFKELSFLEVKTGLEFFDKVVDKYNLNSTPTIIIANPKQNRSIKLEGRDEISEEKILKAIEDLSPKK